MEQSTLERSASEKLQKQIAELAFRLYEARGRQDGHDIEDWLRAEAVLRRETVLPRASVSDTVYEE